jgi:serine/threonine protein kinase
MSSSPQISRPSLPAQTKRSILKSVLTGLAELHNRGIMHTGKLHELLTPVPLNFKANISEDIKPDNILVDYNETPGEAPTVTQLRISDLEDSVLLVQGSYIEGCLCGNELWRSPESWARAKQDHASDIYSFAVVAIYVMQNYTVFRPAHEEVVENMPWWAILRRHISCFGDEEGFRGLLRHVGQETPFFDRFIVLAGDFDAENPRKPFAF